MQITIQLPETLRHQLLDQAEKLNISLESLIIQSLTQATSQVDEDDMPKDVVLASLRRSLQDAKDGKVRPVAELWDGIDE